MPITPSASRGASAGADGGLGPDAGPAAGRSRRRSGCGHRSGPRVPCRRRPRRPALGAHDDAAHALRVGPVEAVAAGERLHRAGVQHHGGPGCAAADHHVARRRPRRRTARPGSPGRWRRSRRRRRLAKARPAWPGERAAARRQKRERRGRRPTAQARRIIGLRLRSGVGGGEHLVGGGDRPWSSSRRRAGRRSGR